MIEPERRAAKPQPLRYARWCFLKTQLVPYPVRRKSVDLNACNRPLKQISVSIKQSIDDIRTNSSSASHLRRN